DFGDKIRADRLTVGVELDLAVGRVDLDRSQSRLQLGLIVAEVSINLLERKDQRHRRVVIVGREQRWAGEALLRRERGLVVLDEGLPARIFPGVGLAAGRERTDQGVL